MISHLLKTISSGRGCMFGRTLQETTSCIESARPHLIYVIVINTLGRSMLISRGCHRPRRCRWSRRTHGSYEQGHQEFKFEHLHIPNDFKRRGVDKNILKNYYYRDDAMEGWTILRKYISRVLKLHYPNDDSVRADTHVQSMILDAKSRLSGENAEQHGIPSSINSFEQLVDVCTLRCIMLVHARSGKFFSVGLLQLRT